MTDCPNCEYHKQRAARWRAEAYAQAGHDVIERPWIGLTDAEIEKMHEMYMGINPNLRLLMRDIEAKLRSKNT